MSYGILVLAVLAAILVLWIAYRIGRIVMRIAIGLLFLGFAATGLWYLLH